MRARRCRARLVKTERPELRVADAGERAQIPADPRFENGIRNQSRLGPAYLFTGVRQSST